MRYQANQILRVWKIYLFLILFFHPLSADLISNINTFSEKTYLNIEPTRENFLFSPCSLFEHLSTISFGASGPTKQEIQELLNSDDFSYLNILTHPSISRASSLWIDSELRLNPEFLENIPQTECFSYDFSHSIDPINQWVFLKTNHLIPQFLQSTDLTEDSKLLLIHTLLFKGSWQSPFSTSHTTKLPFYLDEQAHLVDTMHQLGHFLYVEEDQFKLVALPIKESNFAFFMLLAKNPFDKKSFEWLKNSLPLLQRRYIDLFIPKFQIRSKNSFIPLLKSLGVSLAFTSHADFSKISSSHTLLIEKILQETFLSIDEHGILAGSATGTVFGPTAFLPEDPILISANHPFLFGIVDLKSNIMLFLGKMIDPR